MIPCQVCGLMCPVNYLVNGQCGHCHPAGAGVWPWVHAKTVVLANGCFDPLHIGHIRHLEAAKRIGDVLVATVTQDDHVNKGPGRPVFNQNLRAESVAALRCVDYVFINSPIPGNHIKLIRPSLYVKGSDYIGNITPDLLKEQAAVESVGGKLVFTNEPCFSSTRLLNTFSGK